MSYWPTSVRILKTIYFRTFWHLIWSDWPKNVNAVAIVCTSPKIKSCTKPQWYLFSVERVAYHRAYCNFLFFFAGGGGGTICITMVTAPSFLVNLIKWGVKMFKIKWFLKILTHFGQYDIPYLSYHKNTKVGYFFVSSVCN